MRTMMKISIPIAEANRASRDGSAKRILQSSLESLRPEAAYYFPAEGGRTIILFIDLKETSDMPAIADPFFQGFGAIVTFTPVMNTEDFLAGLAKLPR